MTLEIPPSESEGFEEDSIVCYCYRLTTRQLKDAYRECGSLKGVEDKTRAGLACTGCKLLLESMFGEAASANYDQEQVARSGTTCLKPGHKTMKGFLIANEHLDSTVYSSNGVAPQLGECDATTQIEYAVLDHRGVPVLIKNVTIKTNETFVLSTKDLNLQRPFIGMFLMTLGRSNPGASRFNVYWHNAKGAASTHENASSGKPRTYIPLVVDQQFIKGPNSIYVATQNPHSKTIRFEVRVYDLDSSDHVAWESELPPLSTTWVDASTYLYGPALVRYPNGRFVLRIMSPDLDLHNALSNYFFVHNRITDLWTSNHI